MKLLHAIKKTSIIRKRIFTLIIPWSHFLKIKLQSYFHPITSYLPSLMLMKMVLFWCSTFGSCVRYTCRLMFLLIISFNILLLQIQIETASLTLCLLFSLRYCDFNDSSHHLLWKKMLDLLAISFFNNIKETQKTRVSFTCKCSEI